MGRQRLSSEAVAERLFMDVTSSRKKQRNLLVTTLRRKFHYKNLTADARHAISDFLKSRGLTLTPDLTTVKVSQRVTIGLKQPPPGDKDTVGEGEREKREYPPDVWFEELLTKQFRSETEVVVWFILPLLEKLGYVQANLALSHPVKIQEGKKKTTKQADVVAFMGADPDEKSALLAVEAKKPYLPLDAEVLNQARSYAINLHAPYYMATNGKDLIVRQLRLFGPDVELVSCPVSELKDKWLPLYDNISKASAATFKETAVK